MPERAYNKSNARTSCPDCGSKTHVLHRMGVTLYVLCGGECQSRILGEIDPWDDRLDPRGGASDGE